jgi:TonB family protein
MNMEQWLGSMGETAPKLPDSTRYIGARTSLSGPALVGQYVAGESKADFKDPGDFSGLEWEAPDLKQASSKGARCMEQVGLTLSKAFEAVSYAATEERATLWRMVLKEVQEPLACAVDDSATGKMAGFARERLALFVAGQMERQFNTKEQLEILHKACEQGHDGACQEEKRVRAMPQVRLARVQAICGNPATSPLVIRVPGGDKPTRPALSEISNKPPADHSPYGRPIRSAALAIDRGATCAKYYAVAKGLGHKEIVAAEIVVEAQGRGVVSLPVDIAPRIPIKEPPPPKPKGYEGTMGKPKGGILALLKDSSQFGGGLEGPPVWIHVKQETIEVKAPGEAATFKKPVSCPEDRPCLDTQGLMAMLHTLMPRGRPIYLDATPDTPWHNLATVLGSLACTLKRIGGTGSIPPIYLCPPTADVVDQIGKAPKSQPAGKKKRGAVSLHSGTPVIMGALSRQVISGTIRKHIKQVKYCYEKELVRNPSLQGKVNVKFVIAANGKVSQASIIRSTVGNKPMQACIVNAVKRIRFPPPKGGGIVIVSYPFVFRTAK